MSASSPPASSSGGSGSVWLGRSGPLVVHLRSGSRSLPPSAGPETGLAGAFIPHTRAGRSAPMSQTVVVTGASAGVGRATAVAFASRGDRVGLLARGSAGLAGALAEVEAAGGTGVTVEADVADHEAVERAAAEVEERLGPIDVWVNDAMATVFAPLHEITAEEFRRSTEVTYLGTVHGTMAALRR